MEFANRKLGRLVRGLIRSLIVLLSIGVTLLLLDFGLRNLGSSGITCQSVFRDRSDQLNLNCELSSSSDVVVYLPGVIAKAASSSSPVLGTWLQVGDVQLVDYLGDRFDPQAVARGVANLLERDFQHYERIHIYAGSLGCFVAADALDHVRRDGAVPKEPIKLLLGDCPSGPDTMKPNSWLADYFFAGPIVNTLADGLSGLRNVIIGSRGPDDTLYWSWSSGNTVPEQFEPGVDIAQIQAQQRKNSAGFALSAFTDQLRYMRHGVPDLAGLSGAEVTYLMCSPVVNGAVSQPRAMSDWLSAANTRGLTILPVSLDFPSNHIDYWAWPQSWNRAFRDYLVSG